MPLYEYECKSCGFEFEELLGKDGADKMPCRSCGKDALRRVSRFASIVAKGSTNESADMSIGREADSRWQKIHDRRSKRIGDKKLGSVSIPKSEDGRYMPVMALGDQVDRKHKVEYVGALQNHRQKRVEKGQSQFDGPGLF